MIKRLIHRFAIALHLQYHYFNVKYNKMFFPNIVIIGVDWGQVIEEMRLNVKEQLVK